MWLCHCSHYHLGTHVPPLWSGSALPLFLSSVSPGNQVPGAWWASGGKTVCEADKYAKAKKTYSRLWHCKEQIIIIIKTYGNKPCPTGVMRFANS